MNFIFYQKILTGITKNHRRKDIILIILFPPWFAQTFSYPAPRRSPRRPSASGGSQTSCYKPGLAEMSFLFGFRVDDVSKFNWVIDNRDVTAGNGTSFAVSSSTGGALQLRIMFPSSNESAYTLGNVTQGKWYVAGGDYQRQIPIRTERRLRLKLLVMR